MSTAAIIIPFYQERAGVLARSLRSVFEQDVGPTLRITIIIVDDQSPLDPAGDIAAAGVAPQNIRLEVLRRANGGPGAARNTGLEAAAGRHNYIAFLDSDDWWRADHLSRALQALGAGADLYFSDYRAKGDRDAYLQRTRFHAELAGGKAAEVREIAPGTDVWTCSSALLAEWAVREYLAQTSTIVYRAERLGGVRFSEMLRFAGEDHLFFLDLTLAATLVGFSLACEVELGAGVNIYEGARTWGDARDLRRRTYNLGALKLMSDRARWSAPTRRLLAPRLAHSRRTVGFLLFRQMLRAARVPIDEVRLAWRCDKLAVVMAPLNAGVFAAMRLVGSAGIEDRE